MKQETEPFLRPPKRQEASNFNDVLAQIPRSGNIYVVKSLPKMAIQALKTQKTAKLTLPPQFIREKCDKMDQWVTLRSHSSCGRSVLPLVVKLSVSARSPGAGKIQIGGGLHAVVAGNRLQEGDSLIFVPQEDASYEYKVYAFRGTREFPLFPDEGDSASSDEENNNNQSRTPSPLHHQDKHKKAFTGDITEGKATALMCAHHLGHYPSFRKQLKASSIGRSDRELGSNTGQFELPTLFMSAYGEQVQASVQLQGIHEDSPVHVIPCRRRRSGNRWRVHLLVTEWNRFVKDNGLKKGHELQFSLVADSYFVVRKV